MPALRRQERRAMHASIVKRKLREGKPVLTAKVNFESPAIVEMMGMMGYDCVWVCNEHLYPTDSRLDHLVTAARAGGMDFLLRRTMSGYQDLLHPLEMGVHGFMIPRVTSAEYVRQVVRMVKFPPLGSRGLDGVNADADFGLLPLREYIERSNRETFLVIQIEEPEALDHLEEIAAVEGVDVLFVGPGDLSLQLGIPGELRDPRILAACDRVVDACRRHGKVAGTTTSGPEDARSLMDRGFLFFGTGADYRAVRAHLAATKEGFSRIGFSFGRPPQREG
jgi:4-hydroxy-2-oxoheptanedioate aldolase